MSETMFLSVAAMAEQIRQKKISRSKRISRR